VSAVFLVYQPAWQGGLIWDDAMHVTCPELRDWRGLYRIWFDVGATLQYYPLAHSAFWLQHRLWGDATLGYHLVNIVLHAASALMVAWILRRLAVPGACLAAAIFALHPVQVESVAWITELKNTLSTVFYLAAMTLYLRFDRGTRRVPTCGCGSRKTAWYLAALGLFLLALTSKTVTGTLPGALLVILWWQRGRLSWKKDVLPLTPFFLAGAGMGMLTAWWELKFNQCLGPEFDLTPVERILIAGRAAWFHLGKLFWPANLTFTYHRWKIDAGAWRQYLFPLGWAALLAMTWAIRRRTRAPLAAVLFFSGTLFPTLGFFNLYTFRYSFVADHYQYLASLGIIASFSAGLTLLVRRAKGRMRLSAQMGCLALVTLLAGLSWLQSPMYVDIETLYRTTIDRNPACWLAYGNLGNILASRGRSDEAIAQFGKALEIRPDDSMAHYNLGNIFVTCGQVDEAIAQYQTALKIRPDYAEAHGNLGIALAGRGQVGEALAQFERVLDIDPDNDVALNNIAWLRATHPDPKIRDGVQAVVLARRAAALAPNDPGTLDTLAAAYAEAGRFAEAVKTARQGVELATQQGTADLVASMRAEMRLYEAGRPFHQAPKTVK
jgi:tetratricopeptide (TPR) repeat protein